MTTTTPSQDSLQLATPDGGTTNVEKYEFEPIKGYPMLNWRGKRPFTSTQYYPAQLKEVHGEEVDGWRNKIFWGDNLQVMSHLLKQFRGKVDLIYIDPPFDSKADYKKKVQMKGRSVENDQSTFEEKQYGDIWTNDEYLQYMYERLVLLRELLTPTGCIYLHCDAHKVHHLRCLLDEVFGGQNFRNEVIWHYRRWTAGSKRFQAMHDNLLFYSKSDEYYFGKISVEATESQKAVIEKGYNVNVVNSKDGKIRQLLVYDKEKVETLIAQGRIDPSNYGRVVYINTKETIAPDVWTDIQFLHSQSLERTDYPTQKPQELLERLLTASCPPGGLVLDSFVGSGTTAAAALATGRRFLCADINLGAIQTVTRRLLSDIEDLRQQNLGVMQRQIGFEVYNVNHYDIFRNPVQAKELLIEALEVQKLEFSTVFDGEKDGRMVKIMPVNRIATRADLNELIAGFDYKAWERKQNESPNRPVEKITLVCMGHEPDLAAQLELAAKPFKINVEVVDILRDKADLEFKRDSQAKVSIKKGELVIEKFYPMNLLQKLSMQKESVENWKELVESVLIDWNYDGAVLQPAVVDIPGKSELVQGAYKVPDDAGTIHVKITDLLSESWEGSLANG
ncbi:MAG TPA: site-specific DNA-methyltransferase [Gallionella sp.]|nr:site-specific DNA-methyltransferase [Gallionella sp.]